MKAANINEDQALIIQIIEEFGEEEVDNMAMSLRFERKRFLNIIHNLQRKGLIRLRKTGYGTFASLSNKGQKTARLLWPELPSVNYR